MIKIYNPSKAHAVDIEEYENLLVEEEVSQLNMLSFDVPKEIGAVVSLEGYAEVENNGRYVIKERNLKGEGYEILAQYDLEELQAYIESKAYISMTLKDMMDNLLAGTGWSFQTSDTQIKTATGTTIDRLDFIYAIIRDTFGLEIKFDNQAKTIIAEAEIGEDKGVYFHNEVNLDEIVVDADTYDFATRIIPRGKDGLSIESINGGLPYLENLSHSNKIITKFWRDERYTVAENLKSAAQKKLDVISNPLVSYSAKVIDLSRISGIDILAYGPGDTITLIDEESGIREKQRILVRKKYLEEPDRDSVTIANRMRQTDDSDRTEFDGVKRDFTVIRANLELLDEAVKAKVSQNAYDEDKDKMDENYAAFKLEYDNFTVTVQSGGGNNLIKNSVGYADDKYWEVVAGELLPSQSTWVLNGEAKHGIKLSGSNWIQQDIAFKPGETYTLVAKVKKGVAGTLSISIDDLMSAYIYRVLDVPAGEAYDGVVSFEFVYDMLATYPGLSVQGSDAEIEITDLMLAKGKNINYWSQANGEVYTLKVQTDAEGVKVYRADGNGYTIMSPEEFAGYYNNQKIFTLNGDITEVMGLEIKGKGLWIRPIKIVQTSDSIDFVWTGV